MRQPLRCSVLCRCAQGQPSRFQWQARFGGRTRICFFLAAFELQTLARAFPKQVCTHVRGSSEASRGLANVIALSQQCCSEVGRPRPLMSGIGMRRNPRRLSSGLSLNINTAVQSNREDTVAMRIALEDSYPDQHVVLSMAVRKVCRLVSSGPQHLQQPGYTIKAFSESLCFR